MKTVVLLMAAVLLLAACDKKDETGKVTFYLDESYFGSNWSLIVDGKDRGMLSAAFQMPVCGDEEFIVLDLPVGPVEIDTKNHDGQAYGHPYTYEVEEGCHQHKVQPY
ncbi:MAG: hypothetical protein JNM00_09175 [Flavobacteriales bacterium]|nr:hypothetical protein [Flavobacteriales bacterium]